MSNDNAKNRLRTALPNQKVPGLQLLADTPKKGKIALLGAMK
ncbi:hypothetical protein [Nostoc sp. FACHB-892]|nr:hypothetical protein [Nostoc sp. FACHB-892]